MVKAVIINENPEEIRSLEKLLGENCPEVDLIGIGDSMNTAIHLLASQATDLVFLPVRMVLGQKDTYVNFASQNIEAIFTSSCTTCDKSSSYFSNSIVLTFPIDLDELLFGVRKVQSRVNFKQDILSCKKMMSQLATKTPVAEVVGIPTLEGLEFINAYEIIRCEGMQRYTRIITRQNPQMVSSYNIGAFIKLLDGLGFFSPHKSHLVNLRYIKKFTIDNMLEMEDGSSVPVSRRRKTALLDQIKHL